MRHCLLIVFFCASLFLAFTSEAQSQGKKKNKATYWSNQKDAHGDLLPVGAIARIGTLRYRLPDSRGPQAAALSPDGKLLAALGINDEIEIFELPAWKRLRAITGRSIDKQNPAQFQTVAFSADSKKLVTCDVNQEQIHLLDVATGKSIRKVQLEEKKKGRFRDPVVQLSRDERTLICTFLDDRGKLPGIQLIVWDLDKGKLRHDLALPIDRLRGNRPNVIVAADAGWVAQSVMIDDPAGRGVESHIELWDLTTGKMAPKIETETHMPNLALSADGKWLAAANDISLLRIYEVATGKEVHNIRGRTAIQHLEFAADGLLYLADEEGKIQRWDAARGERLASWQAPGRCSVVQFAFPGKDKVLALGMNADAVHFWEVETGKLFSPKDLPADAVNEVAFSPQGELFVGTDDGMAAWWNPRTGFKLRDLKLELRDGGIGPFVRRDVLADGIAIRGRDFIPGRPGRAGGGFSTMSSSGEFIATIDGGGLTFFDVKTGKLLYDEDTGNGLGNPVFLEGGSKSASVQNKKVRIWDSRTGRDLSSFTIPLRSAEQSVRFAASPKGKHFAVETVSRDGDVPGGRIILWDVEQKKIIRDWATQNGVEALQFSGDQRWLAIARPQAGVQLTRVGAGRVDHDLIGTKNESEVTQLCFSPDSRQLACAVVAPSPNGRDAAKIQIFEIYSKKIRLELVGHRAGIIDRLAYSADGALMASGATDTTALVWNSGLRAFAATPLAEVRPADLDAWLAQMSGANAQSAFQSMIKLARARQHTVALFEDKIAPAKKPDTGEKTIKQWISDLGSGQFAARTKANQVLQKIGPAAEPGLREALKGVNDIETRRRIEELLDRIAQHEWTGDEVTHARAVEVLEAIASPEARAVLTRWTTGDPAAILTIEARKALAYLGK